MYINFYNIVYKLMLFLHVVGAKDHFFLVTGVKDH